MVVDREVALVVCGVVQAQRTERDVAHGRGEAVLGYAGVLETFVADLRGRIERRRDPGRRRVEFDTDHRRGFRRVPDERACTATRFEYPSTAETSALECIPHHRDDGRIGVVGVDGGEASLIPLLTGQQRFQA